MLTNESPLYAAYCYHRSLWTQRAYLSIEAARRDLATGKTRYKPYRSNGKPYAGNWQPADDSESRYKNDSRAYYAPAWPQGWRDIGSAYDIARRDGSRAIDHQGWYLDSTFQDETCAGYVLQLPARNGVPLYVPGISDTASDGVTFWPLDRYESPIEAAIASDGYAERYAEREREYQDAWRAGVDAAQKDSDQKMVRKEVLRLCADLRATKNLAIHYCDDIKESRDRLCGVIRGKIKIMLRDIERLRSERDELLREWSRSPVFSESYKEGV